MIFGRDDPMALKRIRLFLTAALFAVVLAPAWGIAASDKTDQFEGIWTEDLERESGRGQLTKERLDQIIKYASQGKPEEEKRLRKLYQDDQKKFWDEVRKFFQANRPQGNGQGPRGGQWREQLQRRHDEFIQWLKENYPELEKDLTRLREDNPDEYFRRFLATRKKYESVRAMETRHPALAAVLKELIDMADDRDELLREIHCAGNRQRRKLIEELRDIVSRRFDLIVKKKTLQYRYLRERLQGLQEELAGREQELGELKASKKHTTASRVEALLNRRTSAALAGSDPTDEFEGIWTEDLDRESGRPQLTKERLDQIIKSVSQGKPEEEKRLRKLHEDDEKKFWDEAREFFRRNRPPNRGPGPGPRGPNGQGPRGGRRGRERSQKYHDDLLALIKEYRPELAGKLTELRESSKDSDRDKYFREFSAQRRIWGPVVEAGNRGDTKLAGLLIEDMYLVEDRDALLRKIHFADKKRRPKLIAELEGVVSKRFDLILKKKKLQYEALRRRLRRLQEELEGREQELEKLTASKKQAITKRVNELVPGEKTN